MAEPKDDKTVALTETAEFKAAVAAAVAAASPAIAKAVAAEVQAELLAKAQAPGVSGLMAADGFAERLALAIAEISDQGTSRKRVAPEILAARARAHQRTVARIVAAREKGEKPEYRVIAKTYLNDQVVEPFTLLDKRPVPTEITWSGMPNDAMRPLNEVAKEIYAEYRDSIASTGPVPGADNRTLSMTQGGLIIKGLSPAHRREVAAVSEPFDDDLNVRTQNDPTRPFINVLGTIAPAARQNASDTPQAFART